MFNVLQLYSSLSLVYWDMLKCCTFHYLNQVTWTIRNILGEKLDSINTDEKANKAMPEVDPVALSQLFETIDNGFWLWLLTFYVNKKFHPSCLTRLWISLWFWYYTKFVLPFLIYKLCLKKKRCFFSLLLKN